MSKSPRTIDGIEVLDAKVDDELVVTQEDIDKAIPRDHHNCALGVAWKRGQTDLQDVLVYKSRAFKLKDHFGYLKWFRYGVSRAIMVQQAILDNGGHFSPGTYVFKVLTKSKRTGKQQGSETRPDEPKEESKPTLTKSKRTKTPMRSNAPTAST